MRSFEGIQVLDLTQSVAGPVCTQFLGSMGADIVKVEPPGGEIFRTTTEGAFFSSYNLGNKRSLSIDLKTPEGQAVVAELAADADVVVENYRPRVLEKFELDYDTVSADNEDVVYCSVSGFGQTGPYSDRSAFDPVIQAMSGLMAATGDSSGGPARIGASVIDCGTGTMGPF
jgi:crotonobetainyl-CoA:carnitine CoA-transferase CaiB-like acyl-CoA transferase